MSNWRGEKKRAERSANVPGVERVCAPLAHAEVAVDLIEFATAALYTGARQPMGARRSPGFNITLLHCVVSPQSQNTAPRSDSDSAASAAAAAAQEK